MQFDVDMFYKPNFVYTFLMLECRSFSSKLPRGKFGCVLYLYVKKKLKSKIDRHSIISFHHIGTCFVWTWA